MADSADFPSVPQRDEASRGDRTPLQVRHAFARDASGHGARRVSRFQAGGLAGADQRVHGATWPRLHLGIARSGTLHVRHPKVDDRWGIPLDRGLDIWQRFDSIEARMPKMRRMKAFETTYMKVGQV